MLIVELGEWDRMDGVGIVKWCVEVIGRMGARVVGDGVNCPPIPTL